MFVPVQLETMCRSLMIIIIEVEMHKQAHANHY